MRKKPATKAAAKTTAKAAVKETAAEVKNTVIETAAEKTEEVVKSEEKKVAEAVETVKEATETVKEAAKKVTEKAAKTVAKKATAAKKEEVKPEVFVQFQGQEAVIEEVVEKAKKQFVEEGHRASSIKSIQVYLKPEEFAAYYVINQKHAGRVNLF